MTFLLAPRRNDIVLLIAPFTFRLLPFTSISKPFQSKIKPAAGAQFTFNTYFTGLGLDKIFRNGQAQSCTSLIESSAWYFKISFKYP